MKIFLISHSHWDREWYRTFESFRARLVDLVDSVLDRVRDDDGYRFVLDGQTIILDDYLEIRPQRRGELVEAIRCGKIAVGPWYVQPDSFLPSGEAHVRNLLHGRLAAAPFGKCSRVAYTPDSFGHPAQFPQIFAGFDLPWFVYWRGAGDAVAELPNEYRWVAPDGSAVSAHRLGEGYFAAAGIAIDDDRIEKLRGAVERLAARTEADRVLLMNGADHLMPESDTAALAAALEGSDGRRVERATIDDFVAGLDSDLPRATGPLDGARTAELLPGVWSARMPLKLRNRACEALLEGWAEPFAALAAAHGLADERPALHTAWRSLLQNQAHDSICGCSLDRVHEQMQARYESCAELAQQTATRCLERLAGAPLERQTPWRDEMAVAVFNPSPHPRTDAVRVPIDPYPAYVASANDIKIHPLSIADLGVAGFSVDGEPAHVVERETSQSFRLSDRPEREVEFIAREVPAFGWRSYTIRADVAHAEQVDDAARISDGEIEVEATDDGTFTVRFGEQEYRSLAAVEDVGDRGDTYDADPLTDVDHAWRCDDVRVTRRRRANGIASLQVVRSLVLPAQLVADRTLRSAETVPCELHCEARLVPGSNRVDLHTRFTNRARDHRLRLLFPSGAPTGEFYAASTFDSATRNTEVPAGDEWVQPPVATFAQHGWITANGLVVFAPGLPEGEVTEDGTIAITLVRAVGTLARMDLRTRLRPAGPMVATPGAQCTETICAQLALTALDPAVTPWRTLQDVELGLHSVIRGDEPILQERTSALSLAPHTLHLSAFKPAEGSRATVVRVLNPTDIEVDAILSSDLALREATALRLDETESGDPISIQNGAARFSVRPHGLRTLAIRFGPP